ncbi:MAG: D-glycerate dehydrogenase [Dehalococcoidia bacterium]|nr:MAG: D-glycerate dehydrogenase [Dehalococcoidia bacterium]
MVKPIVFVTRRLPGGAIDQLAPHPALRRWEEELPPPRRALLRPAARCHGLLTLLTDRVDAELLEGASHLVVLSNMATGFDNIDVAAASQRSVLVTRTPGVLSETVADFTFALLLAAARRVTEADRYVRASRWKTWGPSILLGRDVFGATLGIVGLGGVGTEVARRARGFGMRIMYYDRARKPALERRYGLTFLPLEDLLRESDFVTLHASLTPQTRGLIGRRELDLMKESAILINTGRGPLVDQKALYEALQSGRIASAALDVTDPEPISPDDPLLTLDNVVVVPHIASASVATRGRMAMLAAENLLAALGGRMPKDSVNREISRTWRAARRRRLPSLS